MIEFFEKLYYNPNRYSLIVAYLLLPLSLIYGLVGLIKSIFIKPKDYNIAIISVGNISVGGSGKTPFAIELIKHFSKMGLSVAYISRGYGRASRGLVWVKDRSGILVDVQSSGDEAMLVAKSCNSLVLVSEDRDRAIVDAKDMGADLIILDDAFSKVAIKKFDILLEPKSLPNRFVLPAGPLREFYFSKSRADMVVVEESEFKRVVEFENLTNRMLLVTAIANPARLEPFLPSGVIDKFILNDHAYFNRDIIIEKMVSINAKSILVTQKDLVKLDKFNIPISIMKLRLNIEKDIFKRLEEYYEEQNRDS